MDIPGGTDPHFGVLGPLRVLDGNGRELEIPGGRQPVVLAALALECGRVVSADHLIDLVWPHDPPQTARTQIQICVSALRKTLTAAGHGPVLRTRRPGYVLDVPEDQVDHHRFRALVDDAERQSREPARLAEAAVTLGTALGLWRGGALEGVESLGLQSSVARLEDERSAAAQRLGELLSAGGDHGAAAAALRIEIARYPLRESLRALLVTTLHRAGRRADALAAYRDARRTLVDELGMEPGEALRRAHEEVLATGHPPDGPDPAGGAADGATDGVADGVPAEAPVRPAQLPADVSDFGGRDAVRDAIVADLGAAADSTATPVVVLVGKPGVGKSALAVHAAHRVREHFPDGALYCELGEAGSADGRSPEVTEILGRFCRSLGVPGEAVPESEAERAALFRTLASGRRMLVVVDDAHTEADVLPLLPGTPGCAVVVTSRASLTGLPGAVVHEIDVLDLRAARELLARVIGGHRVDAEPEQADALLDLVGGLPIALRVVAARLAARPRWPLALMQDRLADEHRRLDELTHGGVVVRASLALSYDELPPAGARLLRLLAAVRLEDWPVWVAAALLDEDEPTAMALLESLVDDHLLEFSRPDVDGRPRYRFHVVIRLFAQDRLRSADPADERVAATARLGAATLAMVDEVRRRVYGGDWVTVPGTAPRRPPPAGSVDKLLEEPLTWLETERRNARAILGAAADAGLAGTAWELATGMVVLFEAGAWLQDWRDTHAVALAAAERAGDERGAAALRVSLGTLLLTQRRPDEAETALRRAARTFACDGPDPDPVGAALAARELAWSAWIRGDVAGAAAGYAEALAGFEAAGDPIGRAHVLGRLAEIDSGAGAVDRALARLHEALDLCRSAGNTRVEIQTLFRFSAVDEARGRPERAETALWELLVRVRRTHDAVGEATILQRLAALHRQRGDRAGARRLLDDAAAVRSERLGRAGLGEVLAELARIADEVDPAAG